MHTFPHGRARGVTTFGRFALFLGILFWGAPTAMRAQTSAAFVALRDADAAPLAALMRIESQQADAARQRASESISRAARNFTNRVARGDVADPLAYVKAHTSHFAIPSDARYDAACSREFSQAQLHPVAVFAIGRPATGVEDAIRRQGATGLTQRDMASIVRAQGSSSAGTAMTAGMRFYTAHGFTLDGPVTSSADYRWHDPERDPLHVGVAMINHGAGLGLPACARMGNTATVLLSIGGDDDAPGDAASSVTGSASAFDAALHRAGMSPEQYEAIRTAAIDAYVNSRSPETLDLLDRIAVQEKDANGRRTVAVQRQNLAWYRRHATELESLLQQTVPN
jgi:hypothetical protein